MDLEKRLGGLIKSINLAKGREGVGVVDRTQERLHNGINKHESRLLLSCPDCPFNPDYRMNDDVLDVVSWLVSDRLY